MGTRIGRPPGSLNKKTIQERELAAQIAHRTMADARIEGRPLAKEVIEEWMFLWKGMAAAFQPTPPRVRTEDPERANPYEDEEKFRFYSRASFEAAETLVKYQSPTFKQVAVSTDQGSGYQDDDQPVTYRTVAQIRQELAERGLPPLQVIIDNVAIEDDEEDHQAS